MNVSFQVHGEPKPGGSKKAFRHPHTDRIIVTDASGKAGKTWRSDVKAVAVEVMDGAPLMEGPLVVEMHFYRQRPKSHLRTNGEVRDSAPTRPTTRPDVLKLARAVEDALTGIVWGDDSQIVSEILTKSYGRPGVFVSVGQVRQELHVAEAVAA